MINSKKLNINVIINARMPTQKAHGIQVINLCQEFSAAGHTVKMIIPYRFNEIKKDSFDYYAISKIFEIKKIPSLDLIPFSFLGRFGYLVQSFTFSLSLLFYCLFFTKKRDFFYSREEISLMPLSFIRQNIFYEMHDYPSNRKVYKIFFKKIKGIIATNKWKKEKMVDNFKINDDKIVVYPNAVNINKFDVKISKSEARRKLNIPIEEKIILYTGHLYAWKGVNTLMESIKFLRSNAVVIYFVGGIKFDQIKIRELAEKQNIPSNKYKLIDHQPHSIIPVFLKAADVLVLPNTAKEKISQFYMGGPLKLMEYMAANRPIIASDLTSVREIVDESNALLFKPDDPLSLACAIDKLLVDNVLAENLASKSRKDAEKYSWENRINGIVQFMLKLSSGE